MAELLHRPDPPAAVLDGLGGLDGFFILLKEAGREPLLKIPHLQRSLKFAQKRLPLPASENIF